MRRHPTCSMSTTGPILRWLQCKLAGFFDRSSTTRNYSRHGALQLIERVTFWARRSARQDLETQRWCLGHLETVLNRGVLLPLSTDSGRCSWDFKSASSQLGVEFESQDCNLKGRRGAPIGDSLRMLTECAHSPMATTSVLPAGTPVDAFVSNPSTPGPPSLLA